MVVLEHAPLLTVSIEGENSSFIKVDKKQLFNAAFTENKSIFPTVSGENSDKIELIQGISNISIAPGPTISCELVTKYPKAEDENKREESVSVIILVNEID